MMSKKKLLENYLRKIITTEIKKLNETYEGYTNRVTFLLAFYLSNESRIYDIYSKQSDIDKEYIIKTLLPILRKENKEGYSEIYPYLKSVNWEEVIETLNQK